MSNAKQTHWQDVYANRSSQDVSWYQPHPAPSLAMIAAADLKASAALIDVGAGASTLVDSLLEKGFEHLTALDISGEGLDVSRRRLGPRAGCVQWLVEDVTTWLPPQDAYDLWHDRAVFHFLVEAEDREAYLRALDRGLKAGGHVVLAPFALTGPERCSGLPVRRYSPEALQAELGQGFHLVSATEEKHVTPGGAGQDFIWCLFRKLVRDHTEGAPC